MLYYAGKVSRKGGGSADVNITSFNELEIISSHATCARKIHIFAPHETVFGFARSDIRTSRHAMSPGKLQHYETNGTYHFPKILIRGKRWESCAFNFSRVRRGSRREILAGNRRAARIRASLSEEHICSRVFISSRTRNDRSLRAKEKRKKHV